MNYDGSDNQPDYPLVQTQDQINALLNQNPIPMVEWGVSFYICLVGDIYGQFGNQLLTIAWAQKYALESGKFLRLSSFETMNTPRLYLIKNWDEVFDETAFQNILIDGQEDSRCHESFTYEQMFFQQATNPLDEVYIPELSLKVQHSAMNEWSKYPKNAVSVHGRSFEGTCSQLTDTLCPNIGIRGNIENLCDYSSHHLRQLFSINKHTPMILFSDRQQTVLDATYNIIDENPFPVQLWMQVISDTHIGNPMSTLDYIIYKWKKQKGLDSKMLPESCYGV